MGNETFKCSYCGKVYASAIDRAKCEIECDKKAEKIKAEAKRKALNVERENRYKEIIEKVKSISKLEDELKELKIKYNNDYPDNKVCYGVAMEELEDFFDLFSKL